jgi:hydroxymethylpyrimidine pyrophosphatase-like HAD family hydrolase
VRLYHLLPEGISKPNGVVAHMRARGLAPAECVAVGDSGEDLTVADVVGTLWLVANAFEHDPTLRPALASHPNARAAEASHGAGVYEAVVTTLAQAQ